MIGNWFRFALVAGLLGAAVTPGVAASAETLVLKGGTLIGSPDAALLADAVVVTTDGVIRAVGRASEVQIPDGAHVLDCTGKTIVAGFWNSHVHFTQAVWRGAAHAAAAVLPIC